MDLTGVRAVTAPRDRAALGDWPSGTVALAGGTWLFSEPQPGVDTLVDLAALRWPALEPLGDGLRMGATCTIAALAAFEPPVAWRAGPLFAACCEALLGSFKVWNAATVGGNVCLALPAAPMVALTVALDGVALVWRGADERRVPMAEFVLGAQRTVLQRGEVLRAIDLPGAALRRRAGWRQASLSALGRSAALLVATTDGADFTLVVTASTVRPLVWRWAAAPTAAALDDAVVAIPPTLWHGDVHGAPAWRRHMTRRLAGELLTALS